MTQNTNKKLIILATAVVALVVGGIIYYKKGVGPSRVVPPQEVGERVINYINENIPGAKASLIDIVSEKGLYKIVLQIEEQEFTSYVTKDGKLLFPQAIDLEPKTFVPEELEKLEEKNYTIGNFLVSEDEICQEDGKPIIYFFGATGCPHCVWEHPIIERVASRFKEKIAFHNNMDTDADMDIFRKYSRGGIPTLVLGCKYYRVGSGERMGEEEEERILTALICKLTNNQPAEACDPVQDLIEQIK